MTKSTLKRSTGKQHILCRTLGVRSGHVSKQAFKRLARKAGVKRMSSDVPSEAMNALKVFLRTVVRDMIIITEHGKRHTATVMDVLLALKRLGRPLYGFGPIMPPAWAVKRRTCPSNCILQPSTAPRRTRAQSTDPQQAPSCSSAALHTPAQQVREGKGLENVSTPTSCGIVAPLLEPETPDSNVSEEHAWRIRSALGAFYSTPECQYLTVACKIPEVHSKLQPYLQNTPCTVMQLRHVIRELAEDESTDIYYDDMEDRVIF
ncbi:g8940 [Coccomyxa elongata]